MVAVADSAAADIPKHSINRRKISLVLPISHAASHPHVPWLSMCSVNQCSMTAVSFAGDPCRVVHPTLLEPSPGVWHGVVQHDQGQGAVDLAASFLSHL